MYLVIYVYLKHFDYTFENTVVEFVEMYQNFFLNI